MRSTIFNLTGIAAPALFLLFAASCQPKEKLVDGWVPVYNSDPNATIVRSTDPVTTENGGKIYVKGTTLYQVETGKGIHVIDISQPAAPKKQKFIAVTGAQEISIKGNFLYTNNMNDLVVVDIANVADAKEVSRQEKVFHLVDQSAPPESGYFECIDPSKGIVTGWERKKVESPKCVKN